jgi:hypothetical protein
VVLLELGVDLVNGIDVLRIAERNSDHPKNMAQLVKEEHYVALHFLPPVEQEFDFRECP